MGSISPSRLPLGKGFPGVLRAIWKVKCSTRRMLSDLSYFVGIVMSAVCLTNGSGPGHNGVMGLSDVLSIVSLALSLVAIITAGYISVRQATLMHHANELPAFVDLLQEYRTGDFYVHQYFIINDLKKCSPKNGYSGLTPEQRKHFLIMFDYMSSMACLVSFEIVTINHVFAMYGFLFQDLWSHMRPFVERERELTGREIGFVVEDLCHKLSRVSYAAVARNLRISDTPGNTASA
jgi:hypothetical protein